MHFILPADGPPIAGEADALDVIGATFGQGVTWVVIPTERLPDAFFSLRTGLAGAILQKFVQYGFRLAVIGDVSRHIAASDAFRDLVRECNRGDQTWFLPTREEFDARVTAPR
ncbi:DUF4180 domain-containing protein [Herbidospora cretacea]|uniref:DUF4180 domain-containing protein n=1 Tax=Herbidospora cretacea TaxID=28444 RepID=UPI000A562413|nr:DUF4180 domain-containing protein [Herbidospora cretacea]